MKGRKSLGWQEKASEAGGIWVETSMDRKRPAIAYKKSVPGKAASNNPQVVGEKPGHLEEQKVR